MNQRSSRGASILLEGIAITSILSDDPPAAMAEDDLEHLAVFNEIAKALTSTLEPHEVLRSIMKQISRLVRPASWSLLLEDPKTGELYYELAVGPGAENQRGVRVPREEGIAGRSFHTGDIQFEARTLALPLRVRDQNLGVLELVRAEEIINPADLQTLKTIADYAAIAIANARNFQRLQELTITDEHTGLYNARHLREVLRVEVERALRFNHPLSILFIDLDRFKDINDAHGHLLGTELLHEFGRLLSGSIRKVDSAYRYGGDEFAVILVETNAAPAQLVARRLLSRIEQHVFSAEKRLNLKITASFGVATFPGDATSAAELLHAADQAMYRAKARGRNAVVAAGDTPM